MKRGDGQVYKRGETYWIDYFHRGRRYRESVHTDNERTARKLLRERLTDLGRGKTAVVTAARLTFDRLADALVADYTVNGKRSVASVKSSIRHLRDFFGGDVAADIKTPRIRQYVAERQAQGLANGTINRHLAALRRMFSLAVVDEIIDSAPHMPMLQEASARQGTIEPGDFERLLAALPDYLKDPIEFLYRSVGEVRSLEWRDVNPAAGEIRLRPEHSKNKEPRIVPLRGKLFEVIERARANRRLDCVFVFHHEGKRIGDFRKSWRNALKAAGLDGVLVHDMRRSGITNMRRAGVPESTAMKLSGHRTVSVFRRYKIESVRDLEQGLDRLDAYLERESEKPAKVAPIRAT
jgi:integrase